jgi:hypothetical protein
MLYENAKTTKQNKNINNNKKQNKTKNLQNCTKSEA